mmetsp:Transcript_1259/g.3048  ORF Transcript_1259/g.3048 Transcript_1259/m.3048 type:complete len:214 (-) Transcript_1259:166-807(-)
MTTRSAQKRTSSARRSCSPQGIRTARRTLTRGTRRSSCSTRCATRACSTPRGGSSRRRCGTTSSASCRPAQARRIGRRTERRPATFLASTMRSSCRRSRRRWRVPFSPPRGRRGAACLQRCTKTSARRDSPRMPSSSAFTSGGSCRRTSWMRSQPRSSLTSSPRREMGARCSAAASSSTTSSPHPWCTNASHSKSLAPCFVWSRASRRRLLET